MKRHGNLYEKFLQRSNFELAHENASRHKAGKSYVVRFNADVDGNIDRVVELHRNGEFAPSECRRKDIQDRRKHRVLSIRPYTPDKVTQHGVINVAAPIWRPTFTWNTYTNLKGHGLHQCVQKLKRDLHNDPEGTRYCLQIDCVQHYPSMLHDVMKRSYRRKIKDDMVLSILDEFVDTMDGLSLGDPISGWLENLVMTPFDHKVKEIYKVKYYYRFQDDMVFLSGDKASLHELRRRIGADLSDIGQTIKASWQVYPVDARGIDFLGYRFFHGYTLLRKSIKQDIFRTIAAYGRGTMPEEKFQKSMASRLGWLEWCDSYRLTQKINRTINELKPISNENTK